MVRDATAISSEEHINEFIVTVTMQMDDPAIGLLPTYAAIQLSD
jgi:hypothetical protein